MLSSLIVLALAAPTTAFYWTPRYNYYEWHTDPWPERALDQPAISSRWMVSSDAYELKVRMPDLEPASVRAALAQDGTKIEVIGERKIEGCTCTPSTLKEISLPYRPRAEDIDVAMEKDGVLTLRLERHAKADAPTPLTVKQAADKKEEEVRSSFRFVPHSSATATATEQDVGAAEAAASSKLAEQEKGLTERFAAARAVAGANTASQEPSVKEAAAATAEGKSPDDATPSSAAKDAAP